jgi:hypothetical protein
MASILDTKGCSMILSKKFVSRFFIPILISLTMPMAHAATVEFNFSKSLTAGFPDTRIATLTIVDIPGGSTKWTLTSDWGSQYGSAFLYVMNYDVRGVGALASFSVVSGAVSTPRFDRGPDNTRDVRFQLLSGSGQFNTGESVSWVFTNSKAEEFKANYVQINGINNGASVKFAASAPIPQGTVSRDFTDSVGGIDANANGVRDDIEDFIVKTYTDSKQRATAMQIAASYQYSLLNSATKQAAIAAAARVYRSLDCAIQVFGGGDFVKKADDILAMTLNTKIRAKAYVSARVNAAGTVYDTDVPNPCDSQ